MFHPLKDFLPSSLKRTGAEPSVTATMIVEASHPLLSQMMPNLRPTDYKVVSYSGGCLTVAAISPAVGQEIRMRTEPILEVLRDVFKDKPMTRLKVIPLIEQEEEF